MNNLAKNKLTEKRKMYPPKKKTTRIRTSRKPKSKSDHQPKKVNSLGKKNIDHLSRSNPFKETKINQRDNEPPKKYVNIRKLKNIERLESTK